MVRLIEAFCVGTKRIKSVEAWYFTMYVVTINIEGNRVIIRRINGSYLISLVINFNFLSGNVYNDIHFQPRICLIFLYV